MRFTHGLRAVTFATLVALSGVSALAAPVAATDPAPTPATDPAPTAAPTPATDPAPTAAPTPATDTAPAPAPVAATAAATPAPAVAIAASVARPVVGPSVGSRVAGIALAQRHKRYVYGASGPRAFDCSGLVQYAYRIAGASRRLGGGHSARGMYVWARAHHLTSRSNPRVGDVVVYGGGTHVAIYIGNGRVVSALNPRQGIRITTLHALGVPFTAFIRTHI